MRAQRVTTARTDRERWLFWRTLWLGGGWAYAVREPGVLRLACVAFVAVMWARASSRYDRDAS